ncbi:hypothetical protein CIRG_02928 [Coccidioides immitis RMSCC 2394]|uniref:Uncharacterized protein n=1 Tax=Coccidioides immitis RMSCC 2394 TaxID=404692 RepID=A0A0J6Y3L1_COCIT|nr:hypothetical protein CIRG_02928 [Coccidioides immitis RMSCC 2394]
MFLSCGRGSLVTNRLSSVFGGQLHRILRRSSRNFTSSSDLQHAPEQNHHQAANAPAQSTTQNSHVTPLVKAKIASQPQDSMELVTSSVRPCSSACPDNSRNLISGQLLSANYGEGWPSCRIIKPSTIKADSRLPQGSFGKCGQRGSTHVTQLDLKNAMCRTVIKRSHMYDSYRTGKQSPLKRKIRITIASLDNEPPKPHGGSVASTYYFQHHLGIASHSTRIPEQTMETSSRVLHLPLHFTALHLAGSPRADRHPEFRSGGTSMHGYFCFEEMGTTCAAAVDIHTPFLFLFP